MPDRVTYEYAIVRLVPKIERQEFINVGVILFSKRQKFLDLKFHLDYKKIRSLSENVDIDLIHANLSAWKAICAGAPEGGTIGAQDMAYRFRWLAAPKSTIIQCSKTHPGLCEKPEKVLEKLFRFYV